MKKKELIAKAKAMGLNATNSMTAKEINELIGSQSTAVVDDPAPTVNKDNWVGEEYAIKAEGASFLGDVAVNTTLDLVFVESGESKGGWPFHKFEEQNSEDTYLVGGSDTIALAKAGFMKKLENGLYLPKDFMSITKTKIGWS